VSEDLLVVHPSLQVRLLELQETSLEGGGDRPGRYCLQ